MMTLELETYDAGLLGDGGGGDVDWWQDYIRQLIEDAHLHYKHQIEGFDIAAIEAGVVKQLVEALRQAKTLLQPYAKTMPDNATSEAFHRISTSIALIATATDIKEQG
jgi:hypothetical protein